VHLHFFICFIVSKILIGFCSLSSELQLNNYCRSFHKQTWRKSSQLRSRESCSPSTINCYSTFYCQISSLTFKDHEDPCNAALMGLMYTYMIMIIWFS
jgi:hypothetical protein